VPLFVILLLLCAACSEGPPTPPAPTSVTAPAHLVTSVHASRVRTIAAQVQAQGRMELASKVSGTVRQVLVAEGAPVQRGQAILLIDDADLAARKRSQDEAVRQAEALSAAAAVRAARAKETWGRLERVFAQGGVSREEADHARAQYHALARDAQAQAAQAQSLRAAAQETEAIRSHAVVTAPVSGILTQRLVDAGTFVRSGEVLAVVEDQTLGLEVVALIDEGLIPHLAPGERLWASVPVLEDRPQPVQVTATIPSVDGTRFRLKTTLPEGIPARSGMFARLFIPEAPQDFLLVPATAIRWRGGLPIAFVVDATDTLRLRVLRLGDIVRLDNGLLVPTSATEPHAMVQVLAGLHPGERILGDAPEATHEGMRWRAP
jgi:RND family efflux transporter MFP subunit